VAPLSALTVPLGFLPWAATTAVPPAVTDGPSPRTWPASPVAYVRQEVGAGAAGTRGGPGAALSREVGAGAVGTRGGLGAALSREVGAGVTGTRGGPGAALSREVGARATGTRGGPRAALPFVLTWSLYVGVPGPQGTNSGHRAHLGRGCEPADGANSSAPRSVILNFLLGS
jgi:hypothetical protein